MTILGSLWLCMREGWGPVVINTREEANGKASHDCAQRASDSRQTSGASSQDAGEPG
ncbi:hypothetical protein P7K49_033611, partial [Saguinus oedipus]